MRARDETGNTDANPIELCEFPFTPMDVQGVTLEFSREPVSASTGLLLRRALSIDGAALATIELSS